MRCKAIAFLAVFLLPAPLLAQDTIASTADEAPQEQPAGDGWTLTWDNRPSLRYGERLRIDMRARFVTDLRRPGLAFEETDASRFDIPRRRIGVSGEIGQAADFQIERELADGRWRDVYLNYRGLEAVEIQGGQFKMPFGLDENTSSTNLDFVYRSQAAALSPGRDPGVMAHGRAGIVRFAAGVFTRDGDNGRQYGASRFSGGVTGAARLLVQPFRGSKSIFEDLQAGGAFTMSDAASGVADLRGPSALGTPPYRPAFAMQGSRRRAGVEMRWRPGPFGVQSEWVRLSSERRGQSVEDTDLPPLAASAWYLHGTWLLTGEEKAKGADEPKRPLFAGGFGSIELAARLERVRFSSDGTGPPSMGPRADAIAPHGDRTMTLGVNWSPNRWIRVQANLVRDTVAEPASTVWSRVVRFRFAM